MHNKKIHSFKIISPTVVKCDIQGHEESLRQLLNGVCSYNQACRQYLIEYNADICPLLGFTYGKKIPRTQTDGTLTFWTKQSQPDY